RSPICGAGSDWAVDACGNTVGPTVPPSASCGVSYGDVFVPSGAKHVFPCGPSENAWRGPRTATCKGANDHGIPLRRLLAPSGPSAGDPAAVRSGCEAGPRGQTAQAPAGGEPDHPDGGADRRCPADG